MSKLGKISLGGVGEMSASDAAPSTPIQRKIETPPAEKQRARSKATAHGRVQGGVMMHPHARKQLKTMAVEQGVPFHQVLADACNAYFKAHGRPEVA